jgi:site-specific DNA-cytosine methylase
MNVLSLFDGLSCGQIALDQLGIKVDNYIAAEIDEYAIKVAKRNYPNTLHVGDVTELKGDELPKIDLLIGGSPCQSFSKVGDGSGFDGSSKLFWEYVRLLKETKPKYFMLENVVMKKEWQDIISEAVGVEPIAINSRTMSAQNRPRLYWTNIPNVFEPNEIGLTIQNVVEPKFSSEYPNYLNGTFGRKTRLEHVQLYTKKASCLTATSYKGQINSFCKDENDNVYRYTPTDFEALQTLPRGYTEGVSNTQRYKMIGNSWTLEVIKHIFKNIKQ